MNVVAHTLVVLLVVVGFLGPVIAGIFLAIRLSQR